MARSSGDMFSNFYVQSSAMGCVQLGFESLQGSRSHIINRLSNYMGYYSEYSFTGMEVPSPLSSPPSSSKLWKTTRFVRQDLTLVLPWWFFLSASCPLCAWRWLWENLLHNFPRKWGEVDWPVVSCNLLFSLLGQGDSCQKFLKMQ